MPGSFDPIWDPEEQEQMPAKIPEAKPEPIREVVSTGPESLEIEEEWPFDENNPVEVEVLDSGITFSNIIPDAVRSSFILSKAHNATNDDDLPSESDINWAMQYQAEHEHDNYWVKSFKRVVPEALGMVAGDFSASGLNASYKMITSAVAGKATSALLAPTMLRLAALGPLGVGAASILAIATTVSAAVMAYSAYDKYLFQETKRKEELGFLEPSWEDVAMSGLQVQADLPTLVGTGLVFKGAHNIYESTMRTLNARRNGITNNQSLSRATSFLTYKYDAELENFLADPADLTVKPGIMDLFNKGLFLITKERVKVPPGEAPREAYNFSTEKVIDPVTGEEVNKYSIMTEEQLQEAIEGAHHAFLETLPSTKEKARYLVSQMADVGTSHQVYLSELYNTLFKDFDIPDNKLYDFHQLFGYNEAFDNILGDYIRGVSDIPENLPQDLVQQIDALKTGLSARDLIKKIGNNVLDLNSKILELNHSLGLEAQPLEGWTPQSHDPHAVNRVGFKQWSADILNNLDEQKTFADPHNQAVEARSKEILAREEEIKQANKKRKERRERLDKRLENLRDSYTNQDFRKEKGAISVLADNFNKIARQTKKAIERANDARSDMAKIPEMISSVKEAIEMAAGEEKAARDAVKSLSKEINQEYKDRAKTIDKSVAESDRLERKKLRGNLEAVQKAINKEMKASKRDKPALRNLRKQKEQISKLLERQYISTKSKGLSGAGKRKLEAFKLARRQLDIAKENKREAIRAFEKTKSSLEKRLKAQVEELKSIEESREEVEAEKIEALRKAFKDLLKATDRLYRIQDKYLTKKQSREAARTRRELRIKNKQDVQAFLRILSKLASTEKRSLIMKEWSKLSPEQQDKVRKDFLKSAYDNIAKRDGQLDGAQIGSTPRSWKQGRVLHFKDQKSFRDYNSKYGYRTNSSILANYLSYADRAAKALAIREKFGPNPGKTIDSIRNAYLGGKQGFRSSLYNKLTENWQRSTFQHPNLSTDKGRTSLRRGIFGVLNDAAKAWRTNGSYWYSLITEPLNAAFAKWDYNEGKAFDKAFGAIGEMMVQRRNTEALKRIGLVHKYLTGYDDLVNNDINSHKDAKLMKAALGLRNAARAVHLGSKISDHNRDITHISVQRDFARVIEAGRSWNDLPKEHKRFMRLAGISEKDYNFTMKNKELFLTDGAVDPVFAQFGDVKMLNWTEALRRIDLLPRFQGKKRALQNLARKWGKAEFKRVERVIANGDKASKAFLALEDKTFWETMFPFMGWALREGVNFIENGDWRLPEQQKAGYAMLVGTGRRLAIGSIITMLKYLERGRMPTFYDQDGDLDMKAVGQFAMETVYHGGGLSLASSMVDDAYKALLNGGIYQSPKALGSNMGRQVGQLTGIGPELGSYAGEAIFRLVQMLHYMQLEDDDKWQREAWGFLPKAPNFMGATMFANRLIIDHVMADLFPSYDEMLRRDARAKADSIAPYFVGENG